MEKTKLLEAFEKCLKLTSKIPEMSSMNITHLKGNWTLNYRVWDMDEKSNHATVSKMTSLIGKLTLDEDLYWLRGEKDDLSVDVIRNKPCKVIGYKTERKPVTKIIETGDFVETKIPVTDCDLRKGTIEVGSYEPIEVLS